MIVLAWLAVPHGGLAITPAWSLFFRIAISQDSIGQLIELKRSGFVLSERQEWELREYERKIRDWDDWQALNRAQRSGVALSDAQKNRLAEIEKDWPHGICPREGARESRWLENGEAERHEMSPGADAKWWRLSENGVWRQGREGFGGEAPPVREVVREIHHYHETRVEVARTPERAAWDIETLEAPRNGRAVYLVTIRDAAKKAFEVEREARPVIEGNLRSAFLASMPGMDERRVRAYAVAEYEGRAIRFRGVAFSVQPMTDGWRYDADTRRGSVRLRISEGMAPEEAKRWARENIEAIAMEKNVALERGKAPPPGARYRCLGESLEDGVLTVEFEAVE